MDGLPRTRFRRYWYNFRHFSWIKWIPDIMQHVGIRIMVDLRLRHDHGMKPNNSGMDLYCICVIVRVCKDVDNLTMSIMIHVQYLDQKRFSDTTF